MKPKKTTPAPDVNPSSQVRELTEDGKIIILPWTQDMVTLALIKTMPGRIYDSTEKCWVVSTDARDRAEVIEIARKLKLEIPWSWLDGRQATLDWLDKFYYKRVK